MLCLQTLTLETFTFAPGKTELSLPRIDVNNTTKETLFSLLQGFENLTFMGNRVAVDARRCRFIHDRTSFIRWDGRVAPCMGLLHSHRTFLYGLEREVRAHDFGDVRTGRPLRDLEFAGLHGFPGQGQGLRLFALPRLRRLLAPREERGRLLRQRRFRPAAVACGPRGSSNARERHERHRQDLQGPGRPEPAEDHCSSPAAPRALRLRADVRSGPGAVAGLPPHAHPAGGRASRRTVREGRWIIYRIPAEARDLVEDLFAGALRERIGVAAEAARDAVRLEACIKENLRGRVCDARPHPEGR